MRGPCLTGIEHGGPSTHGEAHEARDSALLEVGESPLKRRFLVPVLRFCLKGCP